VAPWSPKEAHKDRGPFAAAYEARQQAVNGNTDLRKIFSKNTRQNIDTPAPNKDNIARPTTENAVPKIEEQSAQQRRENSGESALDPVFAAFLLAAQPRLSVSAWNQLRALLGRVEVRRIKHDQHA
jgi:hypothetical protein